MEPIVLDQTDDSKNHFETVKKLILVSFSRQMA
jgi:hypothetical protein